MLRIIKVSRDRGSVRIRVQGLCNVQKTIRDRGEKNLIMVEIKKTEIETREKRKGDRERMSVSSDYFL